MIDWNLLVTLIVAILAADLVKMVVTSVLNTYFG